MDGNSGQRTHAFLADGGEMGARIRAHDWAATPLGPPEGWPTALKITLRTTLTTRHPVFVFWGPDHRCFYNDAYSASLGPEKHPAILGQPGRAAWPEIWDIIGPQIAGVMAGGAATWHEDQLVPILRHGAIQEVYWTYSYGPIHDEDAPGGVGGVLVLCKETTAQVLAERRMRESEARFRNMADSAPVMMWVTDAEARCTYLNRAWYEFTGQTEAEGEGFGWLDATHPDDREPTTAVFLAANARQESFRLEYRLRRADGTYRWAIDTAAPRFAPGGEFLGYIGSVIDIAERRAAEEALRASEAKYRGLFGQLDAGFCVVETRGGTGGAPHDYRVIEANPAFARHTGLVGYEGRWLRAAIPELEDHWFETYGRVALTGEPVRFVNRAAGLGDRWFEVQAFRTGAPEARQVGVLFSDITPRLRAERALREGEALWRGLFEAMQEGFALCDLIRDASGAAVDFRYVQVNAAWERLTGLPAGEVVGRPATEVIPQFDHAWVETYARVLDTGEAARVEREVKRLGAWVEVFAYRVGPDRFAVLILNVTERHRAQERQELLSREVDHRAKNALAVVQAALRLTKAPDLPAYVRAIEGRVSALARAQTLLAEDRWVGADLHALLRGELSAFIGGDGPVATLDGPAVALPAGAAQPLAMAVHELATNAVKYGALSRRAGRVAVGWSVEDGALRLRWEESGGPPVAGAPARRGFGSRVLDATVRGQLGGTVRLSWREAGVRCDLRVPLTRGAAAEVAMAAEG